MLKPILEKSLTQSSDAASLDKLSRPTHLLNLLPSKTNGLLSSHLVHQAMVVTDLLDTVAMVALAAAGEQLI